MIQLDMTQPIKVTGTKKVTRHNTRVRGSEKKDMRWYPPDTRIVEWNLAQPAYPIGCTPPEIRSEE